MKRNEFQTGDLIRGTKCMYRMTGELMKKGKVLGRINPEIPDHAGNDLCVQVLQHKNSEYIGEIFFVKSEYFEPYQPPLLNTRICVTRCTFGAFTVGKIYEIKDGRLKCDYGTIFPAVSPITDIENLKSYLNKFYPKTEFVELVD